MSRSVICHSCGLRLEVDDNYPRRRIRCSACGVMCEVPPLDRPVPFPPPPPEPAPRLGSDPKPFRRVVQKPAAVQAPTSRHRKNLNVQVPPQGEVVACPKCGERMRLPKGHHEAVQCPTCSTVVELRKPATLEAQAVEVIQPAVVMAPDPPLDSSHEDDGRPYPLRDGPLRRCGSCGNRLDDLVVVCPTCGLDLRSGVKPAKVYTPLERHWVVGMSPNRRFLLFFLGQALAAASVLVAVLNRPTLGELISGLMSWLLFTSITSFLLGTYLSIDLWRNRSGSVRLSKTWTFCFIPRRPQQVNLARYEGVSTGHDQDAGCFEWFVFASLVLFAFSQVIPVLYSGFHWHTPLSVLLGVAPATIWWFVCIQGVVYYVGLTRHHGMTDLVLYRGSSEPMMHDIADTLREVGDLPYERKDHPVV